MTGIYIHVPFCVSRCVYCGFYSTTTVGAQDRYVAALCREMNLREDYLAALGDVKTVYIGGGTPSQLSMNNLRKIFEHIGEAYSIRDYDDMEVTLECNPDDVTMEFANVIRQLPINRVSMGAQTFSGERLRFLRRRHVSGEVAVAVERLREAGISNISVDLMFGFPSETIAEWRADIDGAMTLDVPHISAYSLMYEEGTPLYDMLKHGKVKEIDEELSINMYEMLIDRLTAAGYEHYEISNFAKPGYRSRHNSAYWNATPYIGLGAAAHSFDIESRQWNVADINEYMVSIEAGKVPMKREALGDDTRYNDTVTTALRTREGVDLATLRPVYKDYIMRTAEPHVKGGRMEMRGDHLKLTRRGIFVSDDIMSDLIKI